MPNLWTLGGLSLWELLRRTARESWQDAVFGQGGRMAFYHFLAIFPSLMLVLMISQRVPHLGGHVNHALGELSGQLLPDQVSQLLRQTMDEMRSRSMSGLQFLSACGGALWAALNGTWAMIYGLNRAYEVDERRTWWKLASTIVGLTASLALSGAISVFLIFCGARLQAHFFPSVLVLRALEWLVVSATLLLSFAVLYRFAPNLRDHEWSWSTPGALCSFVIWVGATIAIRIYFDHVNDYSRSYGHLNRVVMLLLWLYVTNGAILIGGEMNSEIEKAAAEGERESKPVAGRRDRSGS